MYRQQLCSKSLILKWCIRYCAAQTILGSRPICPALCSVAECFTGTLPTLYHLPDGCSNPVFACLQGPFSNSRSRCVAVIFFLHRSPQANFSSGRSRLTGVMR